MENNVRCGFRVSEFDDSAANHFEAIDRISKLCSEDEAIDETEIQGLSSSVNFLREWKLFNYEPRDVSFEGVHGLLNLPPFSSAAIPQNEEQYEGAASPEPRDFVMYAGGPVWGLDWCPRSHESRNSRGTCEFVAISAHPPGSSHHNLGAPLTGRGLVQIWCVLNIRGVSEDIAIVEKSKKGRRKSVVAKEKPNTVKKPRGRPRKYPRKDDVAELNGCEQHMLPLDTRVPGNSSPLLAIDGIPSSVHEQNVNEQRSGIGGEMVLGNCDDVCLSSLIVKKPRRRSRKRPLNEHTSELDSDQPLISQVTESSSNLLAIEGASTFIMEDSVQENVLEAIFGNETNQLVLSQSQFGQEYGQSCDVSNNGNLDYSSTDRSLPDDVSLPRMVLCLAHNGKVVWDVKWRPLNAEDANCKHRMGFLAVLLGNGSLEVWDVPLPHAIKALYSSSDGKCTDPRFVKLKPVFRSLMLKTGGVQSIPLTVEWSAAAPHNFLLAGCHDGTVALWKFSAGVSCNETRPLLCFSADTVPIRVVSWAPVESKSEGENVIVTAGHDGLKFWDIRDPFRPLWDIHQGSKSIYGLDWIPNPRCLLLSFDDGTMKLLSLTKGACDVPVTGKPFSGTKQQGLHNYNGSSYAIWSVQVSRSTGMVAYCGADGTVVRFQLTTSVVDKEFSRNRAPHFLCCSLAKDETSIRIDTPAIGTPLTLNMHVVKETRHSLRDILFESSPLERANKRSGKSPTSDDQALALCYDVDPPEETLASLKKQKPWKSSSGNKKKAEDDLQLATIEDDEPRSKDGKEDERASKHEALPPKEVAMHRVRWNMNEGCERWLCYGGAAGIVRCQEIVLSETDLKWAMKK